MQKNTSKVEINIPSELRWRIAVLTALAIIVPVLRHGDLSKPGTPGAVAATLSQAGEKGWGMAGMLPGVSPITFGRPLHGPVEPHSPTAG